jgi:glycosyltransferase involved in cell wall biosynthesis
MGCAISVVMPALNEADNLHVVVPATIGSLTTIGREFEVLVVDDGSTDDTEAVLASLKLEYPELRSVRLRRNLGKSAALSAGFNHTLGDVIVLIDADGQDDPGEIPLLLEAIDEGFDLVTGRRADRQDRFVKRRTSQVYNAVTAKVTGVEGHDFNSGLKAMRRSVASSLDLYGDLHRYLPVLAHWQGFRVAEVDVVHHPRLYGTSKYGVARFWKGLFDLITVKFLTTYTMRPFHLFGGLGLLSGVVGSLMLFWLGVDWTTGHGIGGRPALIIAVLFEIAAVQLLSFGLLAELIVHLRRSRESAMVEVE